MTQAMDHQTFHSMEIDALYEELDAPSSAAIREHAASCEACAARYARLRVARQRGLSVLVEAVPENFESRIMAAVDAALAKRAGAQVIPMHPYAGTPSAHPGAPPQAPPGVGAKVIPFFARPSFAVAATLILVLGAAAILTQTSMSRKSASAPMAMSESSPAASAMTPMEAPGAAPVVAATAAMDTATGAVALNERSAGDPSPPPSPMAITAPKSEAPSAKPSKASRRTGPSAGGGAPSAQDLAFDAALSLFNAGRFAEALPRFEALKANNPEAELYAARCIQRTKGCTTATAARFDTAAQRNSGTETGSLARIEGGKCYQQLNQVQAARTRYQAAKDEGFLAPEATRDLEALDQQPAAAAPAATTSPGTPAGGSKASPKAPVPSPNASPTLK